ncbi:MAG: hypothetical protein V3V96_00740, partial [Acidiferrobacterales bacterium]
IPCREAVPSRDGAMIACADLSSRRLAATHKATAAAIVENRVTEFRVLAWYRDGYGEKCVFCAQALGFCHHVDMASSRWCGQ